MSATLPARIMPRTRRTRVRYAPHTSLLASSKTSRVFAKKLAVTGLAATSYAVDADTSLVATISRSGPALSSIVSAVSISVAVDAETASLARSAAPGPPHPVPHLPSR